MRITTQRIAKMLKYYKETKVRLSDERAYIHVLENYTPEDMLDDMIFRSHDNIGRIQNRNISDPTSHIALAYIEAIDGKNKCKIDSFIRMHDEEEKIMSAIDICMKRLDSRERAIIQRTLIEKQSPTQVSIRAHMTVTSLYKMREHAIENLTSLVREYISQTTGETH